MTEGVCRVATDSDVTLNVKPVRLGVVQAKAINPDAPNRDGRTKAYDVTLVPVRQAYVVFATADGDDYVPTIWCRTDDAGYCRIRAMYRHRIAVGDLFHVEHEVPSIEVDPPAIEVSHPSDREHDLVPWDATPPAPTDDALMTIGFLTEPYRVFWTYSAELFELVQNRMAEDYGAAMNEFAFRPMRAEPLGPWRIDFTIPDNPIDPVEQKRVSYLLSARDAVRFMPAYQQRGGETAWGLPDRDDAVRYRNYCERGPVFDVTPEPLRALYLAEWYQAYEIQLREASAAQWSKLLRVRHIVDAAENNAPIPELQEQLSQAMVYPDMDAHFRDAVERPPTMLLDVSVERAARSEQDRVKGLWAERFRNYAWGCARMGVDRGDLRRALLVEAGSDEWRSAANLIRDTTRNLRHGPCLHPWHQLGDAAFHDFEINDTVRDLILDYHKFYVLGFQARTRRYVADLDARMSDIDTAFGWGARHAKHHLEAVSRHDAFLDALFFQVPIAVFWETMDRHTAACAGYGIRWWESFEPPSAEGVRFKAMVNAVARVVGRGASFRDRYLKAFLAEQVKRYSWSAAQASDLLNRLHRYTVTLDHVLDNLGEVTHFDSHPMAWAQMTVDFRRQEVRFDRVSGDPSPLRLGFLTRQVSMGSRSEEAARALLGQDHHDTPGSDRIRQEFRVARDIGQVRTFDVEVPIAPANAQRFQWGNLKVAADVVSTVVAVAGLAAELDGGELRLKTVVSATKEFAALVGDSGALYDLYRATRGIPEEAAPDTLRLLSSASPMLKHAANVLGALKDGTDVLMLVTGYDPEANSALRRDDAAEFALVALRGAAQLAGAVAASTTLSLTGGVAMGLVTSGVALAAAGPLGTVYFAAGVAILVVEGALLVHRSMDNEFERFQRELADVEEQELRIDRERSAAGDDDGAAPAPRTDVPAEEQSRTWVNAAILNARMRAFVNGREPRTGPQNTME